MKDKAEFQMTIGSRYIIRSLESRDRPLVSQGVFKGYTAFGHGDALVIELDESNNEQKGRIRVIPAHMVVGIDVLSAAEGEDTKAADDASRYFG